MTTTLNNSYLVKVSTQGGGGSKLPKILSTWFVHAPLYYFISPLVYNPNLATFTPTTRLAYAKFKSAIKRDSVPIMEEDEL